MTNINNLRLELDAYIHVVGLVGQTIRELKAVPSGVLYARLMGSMDLRTYNNVIGILKRTKLVEEKGYMLTWIGPK